MSIHYIIYIIYFIIFIISFIYQIKNVIKLKIAYFELNKIYDRLQELKKYQKTTQLTQSEISEWNSLIDYLNCYWKLIYFVAFIKSICFPAWFFIVFMDKFMNIISKIYNFIIKKADMMNNKAFDKDKIAYTIQDESKNYRSLPPIKEVIIND